MHNSRIDVGLGGGGGEEMVGGAGFPPLLPTDTEEGKGKQKTGSREGPANKGKRLCCVGREREKRCGGGVMRVRVPKTSIKM